MKVLSFICSDKEPNLYALFADNQGLYLYDSLSGNMKLLASLDNISDFEHQIRIYIHTPYICVTERFGVNAALVNMNNGSVRKLVRGDYHPDVSSYSIAFLEREGRTLLIHQTEWNRLDISDAETGELLTDREIICRESAKGYYDEDKKWHDPQYERKNYIDYFHSLLHISPNHKNFLSNGWVWQPADMIRCYNLENFLEKWDNDSFCIEYYNANWDRPCTFIDDDSFVIAIDRENFEMDDDGQYKQAQLCYFRLSDKDGGRWLAMHKAVRADLFGQGDDVYGELHYDSQSGLLIALSEAGAYACTLDGEVKWHDPELVHYSRGAFNSKEHKDNGWQYSPEHRMFYRYISSGIEHFQLSDKI